MAMKEHKSAGPGDAIGARLTELNAEVFERVKEILLEQARPTTGRKTATIKFSVELLGGILESFGVASISMMREIARLERRLAEVEQSQQKALPYRGVYKSSETYRAGDWTTFRGSAWYANQDTDQSPADDPESWVLAIKKGRDAKGVHHHDE